ncbi:glutathione S-transferase family protein [Pseudoprimorskyibacter insulae]|uniref:Glutathione S-transferase n=1 Tax=Pseudoprimorskyibacter insulae TaxID=1695997 RepID=A0A2R8AYF5_9RHOB|nr:glutathione S-transferase family protein [Pseudoprimorskyibacter insulae]SPF81056.1 Glutathione S-transferase [Pseudoprimorskyibacter insulae]
MDYVLHYAPDNASLAVRLTLEELGLPYRTRLVDRAGHAQASDAYRALNPAAKIPTLETPDGPIFETAAILLWLADRHGAMAPAITAPARAGLLKWLFFTSNTVHAGLRMTFYPNRYAGDGAEAQSALRRHVQSTLMSEWALLDAALATRQGPYFGGGAPNILDCYAAPLLRWSALYPAGQTDWFRLADLPALARMAQLFEQRPSAQAAIKAEGLGPHPFTAPEPPTPPEGSAL